MVFPGGRPNGQGSASRQAGTEYTGSLGKSLRTD